MRIICEIIFILRSRYFYSFFLYSLRESPEITVDGMVGSPKTEFATVNGEKK